MSSVRTQLAAAVRRVNAAYHRTPDAEHIDIFSDQWVHLEREVDCALAAGDDLAARKAIEQWESHALTTFAEASRG